MSYIVTSWRLLAAPLGAILSVLWVDIRKALGRACRSAWELLELFLLQ